MMALGDDKMNKIKPMVTVYTQVYNTNECDLRRCIESVLQQSYKNFEFFIFDNGCTDGSTAILRGYAEQDSRICLTRIEKNNIKQWHYYDIQHLTNAEYMTIIDSDDWWDVNYLEHLLTFAQNNNLDIACTGSYFHNENLEIIGRRGVEKQLFLSKMDYHLNYPYYHVFFRTIWAKLIRQQLVKDNVLHDVKLPYGLDTVLAFRWLRKAEMVGIDSSVLHHYLLHAQSASYKYDSQRFESDIYLYNDAIDFLRSYGPISKQNQMFLYAVYSNSIRDTMGVIHKSQLSVEEKIHEYAMIATHQITQMAYRCQEKSCKQSRQMLLNLVCAEGLKLKHANEDLQRAMQALLPRCGLAVTVANLPLFLAKELQREFLADDRDAVVKKILGLLPKIRNPQIYDLGTTMQRLALGHKLLFQVNDLEFMLQYTNIYGLIWEGKNIEALDQMTGLLLEHKVKMGQETFLNLYINLAAQQSQENAFIFGKIQLANFYYQYARLKEARIVLKELEELGLGELEEIQVLRARLTE